jgi:hypothetical protein
VVAETIHPACMCEGGGSRRSTSADGAGGTLPEKGPPASKLWPRFFWVCHPEIGLFHTKIGGIWPWPARTGGRGDRPAPTALEEPCPKKGRRPPNCGPDFSGSATVASGCFTRKSGVFGLGPRGRGIAAIDPRRRRWRNPAGKKAAGRKPAGPIFLGRTPWNRAASRENRGYLALARADGGSRRSTRADGAGGTLPEKGPPVAKLWPRFFWVGHRGIGLLHAKIGGIWPWPARTGGSRRSTCADGVGGTLPGKRPPAANLQEGYTPSYVSRKGFKFLRRLKSLLYDSLHDICCTHDTRAFGAWYMIHSSIISSVKCAHDL